MFGSLSCMSEEMEENVFQNVFTFNNISHPEIDVYPCNPPPPPQTHSALAWPSPLTRVRPEKWRNKRAGCEREGREKTDAATPRAAEADKGKESARRHSGAISGRSRCVFHAGAGSLASCIHLHTPRALLPLLPGGNAHKVHAWSWRWRRCRRTPRRSTDGAPKAPK